MDNAAYKFARHLKQAIAYHVLPPMKVPESSRT